jgi:Periplasmic binding proteins and sugar binding domain of LacI family
VTLAAFLMQTDPPVLALGIVVLDTPGDGRADAGEGEGHHRNQRPIAETHQGRCVDAVQQLAGLFVGQYRGLAGFDDVFRAAHRMRRIGRDNLADDEPVEQHADRGEVLLDRRLLEILPKPFDIGGDLQRLDVGDLADRMMVAPGEEPRHAGIFVADGGGEVREKAWERGLTVMVMATRGDGDMESAALAQLTAQPLVGLIYATINTRLVDAPATPPTLPTVLLNCHVANGALPSVVPGEAAGGHAATDVLIRAGHRRIGYINGEASMEASRHRFRGYRQALATADLPLTPTSYARATGSRCPATKPPAR